MFRLFGCGCPRGMEESAHIRVSAMANCFGSIRSHCSSVMQSTLAAQSLRARVDRPYDGFGTVPFLSREAVPQSVLVCGWGQGFRAIHHWVCSLAVAFGAPLLTRHG